METKIGIWLDKRTAKIVSLKGAIEHLAVVQSNIEEYTPKGGSGTKLKGGPQDVVQDSKFLERKKHQYKAYFAEILEHIKNADALVVFGPAQTGQKFLKELSDQDSNLYKKVIGLEKADSMTDNQIKSWVKNYFKGS